MSFCLYNKKNITQGLEDMNFIFEWQKQYFTHSRLPLENKIHIFAPPCNILYIYHFLSSDMSSVWNFCSLSSHIMSHRTSCGIVKMSAAFSGYQGIGLSSYPRKKTQATTECHPPSPRTSRILFTMGNVNLDIG